ncbi:MAG: PAS domain-containing protein [Verrucomicrobiota bacterium]
MNHTPLQIGLLLVSLAALAGLAFIPESAVAGKVVAGVGGAAAMVALFFLRIGNSFAGDDGAALAERVLGDNEQLKSKLESLKREHEETEHYIEALMENMPANVYFKDLKSRFLRVNRSQAEWLCIGHPSDMEGKTDHDYFEKVHADRALADERRIIATGQPIVGYVEQEMLPDGEESWVLTTKMPFRDKAGKIIGTFGISNNVSELVKTQNSLERERNILRALIDSVPDHIYIKDESGQFLVVNRAFADFVAEGHPEEMLGKSDYDYFSEETAEEFQVEDRKVIDSGEPLTNREGFRQSPTEGTRVVITTKVPLRDENGRAYGIVGMNRDVTESRRASEALRRSERVMESILDNSPAVVYLKANDGKYLMVNKKYESLFNVERKEVKGKTDHQLFDKEVADAFRTNDLSVVENGEPLQVEEEVPVGDTNRIYLSVKFPVRDWSGGVYAVGGISTDITERKRDEEEMMKLNNDLVEANQHLRSAQEQLIQAEKMESVGRLAAGVAHEVKNPLAMLGMGLEILDQEIPGESEKGKSAIERMRRAVERAKEIIRGMVDFSSAHQLQRDVHDVHKFVDESLTLTDYEFRKGKIKVLRDYAEDLPRVRVDATKIEQVLVNLYINATHAMEGGGTLRIRTRFEKLRGVVRDEGVRTQGHLRDGDPVVVIEVIDSGPGIPEDKLGKIFDPFFTTKPTGVGTGLGLSVARKIIDLHDGVFTLENHEEGGACATIILKAEPAAT